MTDSDQQGSLAAERDMSRMTLGILDLCVLYVIFASCLVVSAWLLVLALLSPASNSQVPEGETIEILMTSAICGACIYYGRKLYKAGINRDYEFSPQELTVERVSTIAFYVLRLPASALIALVVYALWQLSVHMATTAGSATQDTAKYLFLIMGFFSGFSAGRFIEYFEREGFKLARNGSAGSKGGGD